MGKLVVDNWTIENAVHSYERVLLTEKPIYNIAFINLIEAIVLWDELFYWENGRNTYWQSRNNWPVFLFSQIIKPVIFKEFPDTSNNENGVAYSPSITGEDPLYDDKNRFVYPYTYDDYHDIMVMSDHVMKKGALKYYSLCNSNGYGYLAIERRAEFLQQCLSNNMKPDRRIFPEYFDKKILEKYPNISEAVLSQPIVYHSIFNRVLSASSDPTNIIGAALDLRQSKDACAFRRYMDIIENEDIDELNKSILKIVKDINKLFKDQNEPNKYITKIKLSTSFGSINCKIPELDMLRDRRLNFFKTLLNDVDRRMIIN